MEKEKKIKLAVIQFYFYPDISAVSQLLGDLLQELISSGNYDITVYCGKSQYARMDDLRGTNLSSINIKRFFTFNFGKKSFVTRVIDYVLYYFSVFFMLFLKNESDIVISMTSPPLISFFVSMALRFKRQPLIYYIQDLFPEILFDMKYLSNPWIIRKMQMFNRMALNKSARVITIGKYMRNKIKSLYRIDPGKILEINNWTKDVDYSVPEEKRDFLIMYSGNMGVAHDFSLLGDIIEALKPIKGLRYEFIGEGNKKETVKKIFKISGESRVVFSGYSSRKKHSENLKKADLFIVSQSKNVVGDLLPSKIYSYTASGRPIIFLGPKNSEIGEMIIENDIGVVFEKEKDLPGIKKYIEELKEDFDFKKKTGLRAMRLNKNKYNVKISAGILNKTILEILG